MINEQGNEMKLGYHNVTIVASIPDSTGLSNITAAIKLSFTVQSNKAIAFYVSDDTAKSYIYGTVAQIPFGIVANTNLHRNFYYTATIKDAITGEIKDTFEVNNLLYNSTKLIVVDTTTGDKYEKDTLYTLSMTGGVVDTDVKSVNENPIFEFKFNDYGYENFKEWEPE
ncbi:hypothetical protein [Intestinibacter sp.]|uniref:hypothetical protein n=1 Tax=Intestinibacter sp. TaxID=1965304 RepID=UPI003F140387